MDTNQQNQQKDPSSQQPGQAESQTLIADMPGVAKEQLVVRVTGDNLLIEGAASVPAVAGNMELVYGEVQAL
ncbi:Hsp20/alpha crystallin family protein [Polaromonas hydrogenivorans]|uniref:Hsp20/alpha crystallin family protein n=1 Tax=Polaromonas hydrogenivorans TaxID=335476 RepID=A0AAU7LN57_9BURK